MKSLSVILVVVAAMLLAACAPAATAVPQQTAAPTNTPAPQAIPDTSSNADLVETALADGRFTTLAAALDAAGLVDTLKGEGPFTVFAPTDEAFAALPAGTVEALLADIPQLTDILLYHVVTGEVMAADVVMLDGQQVETISGDMLRISVQDGNVFLNETVQVIVTDIETANGVIHVIDSVLMPENESGGLNIVETALADGRFTTLAAALDAADLAEVLQSEGPFTVFAPTDEAFAALPAGTVEALLADIPQLTYILLYHVVAGEVMAADVVESAGQEVETVSGAALRISVQDGSVFLNETTQVILTDIETTNGIIHVIDSVLLPESGTAEMDIVETALADGRFTTLAAALEAAGLVGVLQGEGPFTVFAPTDEAFAALPAGTVEALLADIPQLTDILLYHVVDGEVMAADVIALDGLEVETALEGSAIQVSVENGTVVLNGTVQVILTDIAAANGVIHVIDAVLLPPQ